MIDVTTGRVTPDKKLPEAAYFSHAGGIFVRKGNLYAMGVGTRTGELNDKIQTKSLNLYFKVSEG